MKKAIAFAAACAGLFLSHSLRNYGQPQQPSPLQYEVRVINIEVPVRVFKGETFVDNLTLNDFDVYEDGVLQKIEAMYLVKKSTIERKDETKPFRPQTSRYFYLFFVLYEANPKIKEALGYFINYVIQPADHLIIVTPKATYEVKQERLASTPTAVMVDHLSGIVRKDILTGDAAYRAVLNDLKRMSKGAIKPIEDQGYDPDDLAEMGVSSNEEFMMRFRSNLAQLENLRTLDESKMFAFADRLKEQKGQKFVYLFYQREFTPTLDKKSQMLFETNLVLKQILDEVSGLYRRTTSIAIDRLKKAYADSSITINFLYLTTVPNDIARDQMEERSWDIYESFTKISEATGGISASSSNAASLMEKASKASENYYLLYYTPKNKIPDGKFREVLVDVKVGDYVTRHVAGYIAR